MRIQWTKSSDVGPKIDLGHRILKSEFIPSDFAISDCTRRPILFSHRKVKIEARNRNSHKCQPKLPHFHIPGINYVPCVNVTRRSRCNSGASRRHLGRVGMSTLPNPDRIRWGGDSHPGKPPPACCAGVVVWWCACRYTAAFEWAPSAAGRERRKLAALVLAQALACVR